MADFYDKCDPEIKANADTLIKIMKSGEKKKNVLPNTGEDFSEEAAMERFNLFTQSKESDEIMKSAYDC